MNFASASSEPVQIRAANACLAGELVLPSAPRAVVVFAQASRTVQAASRCHRLARTLHHAGIATLLCDLLTRCEDTSDVTHLMRFDIALLTQRLVGAIDWLHEHPQTRELEVGLFGASTGAAAALCASVERPACVRAVVCRSGRPDLAHESLARVTAPTLLIVGGWDDVVLQLNREALRRLGGAKRLEVVPQATSLFDEPGALDEVAQFAARWMENHLPAAALAHAE